MPLTCWISTLIFARSIVQDFIAYDTCLKTNFSFHEPVVLSRGVRYLEFLYYLADLLCAFEN